MDKAQTIAYISDVGASEIKPLFVVGCVLTTIFLDASFISDRLLRHKGRLVPNTSLGEKILSGLSIVFALVGTIGLTFLSGFDTLRHPRLHDVFLILFILGYLLSAVFLCWEFQRLGKSKQAESPSPSPPELDRGLTRIPNRIPPASNPPALLLGEANICRR